MIVSSSFGRLIYLTFVLSSIIGYNVAAHSSVSQFSGLNSLFSQFGRQSRNQETLSTGEQQQLNSTTSQQQVTNNFYGSLSQQLLPLNRFMAVDRKCLMCKFSVSLVNYALKTRRGYDQIDKIANNFCISAQLESPLVCSKISKLFNHEVTKVLTYGVVTPDQVCGLLSNNTCGHFHSPLDDWEINLQASEHLNQSQIITMPKQKSATIFNETSTNLYRVIHLSDTHVDLNYAYGSAAKCEEPLCCQATSTPKNTSTDPVQEKAGYWGSYGFCDIPLRTFLATLKHLNETLGKSDDIEYIIWTGDIQPHDVWQQSKQSALQIYEAIFSRIFKYLPNVIILPTFGNHEMIPVDSFSPSNLLSIAKDDSPIWLYKKFQTYWSRWLPHETEATITRDGFYAATVRPGLKVISLNTNFCHTRNFWLFINSTDPGNQLQWLVHELQMSELTHEKVHIIGHIPPGADDCMRVWSKNYHRIVIRYASTISGQFFGHTHTSEFEMFYDNQPERVQQQRKSSLNQQQQQQQKSPMDDESGKQGRSQDDSELKPISVAQIGPSITTFVDLNPSYRIYTIDPTRNFQPVDYETFYVNLTQANLAGKSVQPQWHSAGMFSKMFGLNDITPQSMHRLLFGIANSLQMSERALGLIVDNSEGDDVEDGDVVDDEDDDGVYDDFDVVADDKELSKGSNNSISTARNLNTVALNGNDQLYELYRLFNSYSDKFNLTTYEKITLEDKKKFVCRLLSGQSHEPSICKRVLPTIDIPILVV